MTVITSMSGRLHSEFVRLFFLHDHRETHRYLQLQEFNQGSPTSLLRSQFKSRVTDILTKVTVLRVNLNPDGVSITSRTHTQGDV
jgi:hypothetical protein